MIHTFTLFAVLLLVPLAALHASNATAQREQIFAMVMDVVPGPHKGKDTGESALLGQLMASLMAGDVVVFDRYYCSRIRRISMKQRMNEHD